MTAQMNQRKAAALLPSCHLSSTLRLDMSDIGNQAMASVIRRRSIYSKPSLLPLPDPFHLCMQLATLLSKDARVDSVDYVTETVPESIRYNHGRTVGGENADLGGHQKTACLHLSIKST